MQCEGVEAGQISGVDDRWISCVFVCVGVWVCGVSPAVSKPALRKQALCGAELREQRSPAVLFELTNNYYSKGPWVNT